MSDRARSVRRFGTREGALAVALAAACALPLLLGAGDRETPGEEENRERIEGMTELERRRLGQRFERYLLLDEAERDRLRSMHARIEEDDGLADTVEAYRAWVATLSPIEREQLRAEADPRAKLELVRKFRADQLEEEERHRRPMEHLASRFGWRRPPKVDEAVLGVIYGVLEERLETTPETRAELETAKSPLERRLVVLRLSLEASRPSERSPDRFRPPRFPEEEAVDQIVANLHNGLAKKMLEGAKSVDGRRTQIALLLLGGIWQEVSAEVERRKPSPDELRDHFGTLSAEERDRLTSLTRDEFENELRRSYVTHSLRHLADVRPVTESLGRILRGGRPPFGGGRRDGRPGDGRPSGDGRPGEGGWRPGDRPGERSGPPNGFGRSRRDDGRGSSRDSDDAEARARDRLRELSGRRSPDDRDDTSTNDDDEGAGENGAD